nr:unnamed protein product [Callosobruchus chinensis]
MKRFNFHVKLESNFLELKLCYVLENRHRCPNCDRTYKWKRGLSQHLRYECGKEPQFACPYAPVCRYRTKVKSHIKCHVKNVHKVRNEFRCPNCNRSYKLRRGLEQHIEFQCGKEPQFICPYAPRCAFRTCLNGDLKKHIFWRHEKYKLYLLTRFKWKFDERRRNNRPFICDVCGRSYKYQHGLKEHKKYMCGIEPRFRCSTSGCSYKTRFKSCLNRHLRTIHQSQAVVQCDF